MNKSTAIKLTNEMLKPYFEANGFQFKKGKWNCFYNEFEGGYMKFRVAFDDYNPMQRPDFLMSITHRDLEEIYEKFIIHESEFNEKKCISKYPEIVESSVTSLRMIMTTEINSAPPVVIEENIPKTVNFIISHIETTGDLIFNKFQDLHEIDKVINGENFWETDYQKLFNLGGGFALKRVIIAHLCSNPLKEEIIKYHMNFWQSEIGIYPIEAQDRINEMNRLIEFLKKYCFF